MTHYQKTRDAIPVLKWYVAGVASPISAFASLIAGLDGFYQVQALGLAGDPRPLVFVFLTL